MIAAVVSQNPYNDYSKKEYKIMPFQVKQRALEEIILNCEAVVMISWLITIIR
jgi:hypothetical protein